MCAGTTPELSSLQLCRIHIALLELKIGQSSRLDDEHEFQRKEVDKLPVWDQPIDAAYWMGRREISVISEEI